MQLFLTSNFTVGIMDTYVKACSSKIVRRCFHICLRLIPATESKYRESCSGVTTSCMQKSNHSSRWNKSPSIFAWTLFLTKTYRDHSWTFLSKYPPIKQSSRLGINPSITHISCCTICWVTTGPPSVLLASIEYDGRDKIYPVSRRSKLSAWRVIKSMIFETGQFFSKLRVFQGRYTIAAMTTWYLCLSLRYKFGSRKLSPIESFTTDF